jgi:hypothetical protein
MGWVIVIVFCLVAAGWMMKVINGGHEGVQRAAKEDPGRYFVGLIVFAVIAFVILLVIGTLTGRH